MPLTACVAIQKGYTRGDVIAVLSGALVLVTPDDVGPSVVYIEGITPWLTLCCPHGDIRTIETEADFPSESYRSRCGVADCWHIYYAE